MAEETDQARRDAALLIAVAGGDRDAFELLYRHYAPWLTLKLRHRCSDTALVDDVVQETFLSVWRTADGFRPQEGADVSGWLWRICSRRLADAVRGNSARRRLTHLLLGLRGDDERRDSAEDEVLTGLAHGDLGTALEKLPPELRDVLTATVLDGLTTREASARLDIPEGTVKTRALRARRRLTEELA
ncbi:RNA polymerase sigma-70 factor (ECF subfamily) [Hamadaea flava]|uniref:RNA polymerase sigma factor n=1 Tax=Hamadaea flava TaxID=1742688 RepID=A0ABV8LGB3_9ACTN|nr:RNA polymerase sigma factor [Hamadaea flava]MCP2324211.1 RNA polymerase sigma-70 factor (ECF subfamily) [Hamadaea flava]